MLGCVKRQVNRGLVASGAGCGNNAFRPHAWRIVREGGKATQDKQVTCDTGIAGLTQGIRLSVFAVYVIHKVCESLAAGRLNQYETAKAILSRYV
jgi:hypothetical protein